MTNKTLEQIQEENRKLIILANNPEVKSYEEALEMELGEKCILKLKDIKSYGYYEVLSIIRDELLCVDRIGYQYRNMKEKFVLERFKIIGKPLTLDRVLYSLKDITYFGSKAKFCLDKMGIIFLSHDIIDGELYIDLEFSWNLTKSTLEEQSEQTQREINKLLTK